MHPWSDHKLSALSTGVDILRHIWGPITHTTFGGGLNHIEGPSAQLTRRRSHNNRQNALLAVWLPSLWSKLNVRALLTWRCEPQMFANYWLQYHQTPLRNHVILTLAGWGETRQTIKKVATAKMKIIHHSFGMKCNTVSCFCTAAPACLLLCLKCVLPLNN